MTKRKLERFAEMATFPNVLQPSFAEVFRKEHPIKGKWNEVFFKNNNPIVAELGCGKGEYTVGLARKFPDKNFLGIDIKGARIWKGAKTAFENNITNVGFLRTRIEFLDAFFIGDELDEIWITFPDPQPKKKNKRLTSGKFLSMYKTFLKPTGIIHLKTDSADLFEYTFSLVKHNHFHILNACDNLYAKGTNDDILSIQTFYEKQFLEQRKNIFYLRFVMNAENQVYEPPDVER